MTDSRREMQSRRFRAAALFRKGLSQANIARRMGVSRMTASRWAHAIAGGSDLKSRKAPGRPRIMSADQTTAIREWYLNHTKTPLNRIVRDEILGRFGIAYNVDHVCRMTKAWREASRDRKRAA